MICNMEIFYTSSFDSDHTTALGMSGCQISFKSDHSQRDMMLYRFSSWRPLAAAQVYFRFRVGWRRCLEKVCVYQQTKFRSYSSIHFWVITKLTSGLKKQTSAILEFYFRCDRCIEQVILLRLLIDIDLLKRGTSAKPTPEVKLRLIPPSWKNRYHNHNSAEDGPIQRLYTAYIISGPIWVKFRLSSRKAPLRGGA